MQWFVVEDDIKQGAAGLCCVAAGLCYVTAGLKPCAMITRPYRTARWVTCFYGDGRICSIVLFSLSESGWPGFGEKGDRFLCCPNQHGQYWWYLWYCFVCAAVRNPATGLCRSYKRRQIMLVLCR